MAASRPLTILTGASRGMGTGLARGLIAAGHHLLTLQRQPNPELEAEAAGRAPLEQWAVDLSDPVPVAVRLRDWLATLGDAREVSSFVLIHNAALLAEPAALRDADPAALSRALRVSLEAPLVITAAVLAATQHWRVPRQVLNISSGLGRFAMAGAAGYCAAKAGLDHLTRALALEEALAPNGARVVSLAPGVIDTDMQVQLRGADAQRFPNRARFEEMKASGALDSVDAAAAKVLAYLQRPDYGTDPIADVRQA